MATMIRNLPRESRADRPLRVAMIAACPFPYPRGTPVRILRMAEALERRGHEVHVVTYHLGRELPDTRLRIHRIPPIRSYTRVAPGPSPKKLFVLDPLLARELGRLLHERRFDVIHAHHYEGLLVARARRDANVPIVFDAHTLLSSELPFYGRNVSAGVKRAIGQFVDRHLPGRAHHVVAVTQRIRDRLVDMGAVPADRVSVVTNGVETELFDAVRPVRHDDVRTIVFAGNLAAYQGVDTLLRAFRLVRDRRRDVRLQVVSESSFEPHESLARELNVRDAVDVVQVGFEALPAYLVSADVTVNPRGDADGIPQKLMNYMAAARPIVSFAGSAAHLVHGETAWLVPHDDVEGFASAILQLLDQPELAARLGRNARAQIDREFSWERTAERTEQVYERLLPARPGLLRLA